MTYPVVVTALQKEDHVVIENRPCKIVNMETDGDPTEVHFVGIDVFTGKVLRVSCPVDSTLDAPEITYLEYSLVS